MLFEEAVSKAAFESETTDNIQDETILSPNAFVRANVTDKISRILRSPYHAGIRDEIPDPRAKSLSPLF